MILEKMKNPAKKMVSAEGLIRYLELQHPEVFLTMGAGDIDQLVGPIEELLNRIMR
jgi:UDP-N-acetylmuramate--alanine ligase